MPTRYWVNDFPRRQGACRDWASFVTALCAASACRDYPQNRSSLPSLPADTGSNTVPTRRRAWGRSGQGWWSCSCPRFCRVRGCARPAQRPSDRPGSRPRAGRDPVRPDAVQLADGPSEGAAVHLALYNNAAFQELLTDSAAAHADVVQAGLQRTRSCSTRSRRTGSRTGTCSTCRWKSYARPHRVDAATAEWERAQGAA